MLHEIYQLVEIELLTRLKSKHPNDKYCRHGFSNSFMPKVNCELLPNTNSLLFDFASTTKLLD